MENTFTLKPMWDYRPRIEDGEHHHHILRESEHNILTDFMIRRNEGSLLVVGNRGVGKTSSVISAINHAKDKNKSLIPILIKATSVDLIKTEDRVTTTNETTNSKTMLQTLIQFLHKAVKDYLNIDKTLKDRTEKLYYKSSA